MISVAYVAHLFWREPGMNFVSVSYQELQSINSSAIKIARRYIGALRSLLNYCQMKSLNLLRTGMRNNF